MSPRWDGPLLALLSLLLYATFVQDKNYGDGVELLGMVRFGMTYHPVHFLYLPLVRAALPCTEPFGLSLYETGQLLSVLGMALGVFGCHAALRRLGLARGEVVCATLAIAVCPATLFFGTVVEIHGPFFALCGLAFWLWADLGARPGIWQPRILVLALVCALAHGMHASGIFLAPMLAALHGGFAWAGGERRDALGRGALLVALATATIVVGGQLLRAAGFEYGTGNAADYVTTLSVLDDADASWLWSTLRDEWLLAFAPLSFLFVMGWSRPAERPVVVAFGCCLLAYLFASLILVGTHDERGAYQLPLVFPATLILGRTRRPVLLWGAILVGLVLGLTRVEQHDRNELVQRHAAELRAAIGDQDSRLITGAPHDLEVVFCCLPDLEPYHLAVYAGVEPAELDQVVFPRIRTRLDELLAAGTQVLITANAIAVTERAEENNKSGPEIGIWLREHYRFEPMPAGSEFLAARLLPKP